MKKLLAILISLILITFGSSDIFAKSSFSGGSSFSSSGSRSSSFSGSSHSSSFSGGGSKSSGFSGGSSSLPKSSSGFSGGSNGTPKSSSFLHSSTAPTKPTFDSRASKADAKDSSAKKFADYKAKSNPAPISSPEKSTSYSSSSYSAPRSERMETVTRSYRPNGYYTPPPVNQTIVYRDNYSGQFLQVATMMWMFNHWDSVDKSRFDKEKLAELEAKVKKMEAEGLKKDPNYVQPGVDPDLQYKAPEKNKEEKSTGWVAKLFIWLAIIGLVWLLFWIGYKVWTRGIK